MSRKWDLRYIKMAQQVSSWSKDPSTQVGAVAVSDKGQVLCTGYNGFPRGIDDADYRYNNRELKYELIVNAEVVLPNRVASITQTMNIVKNEIQDSIFYFSAVTPKTIQIMLKGMEGK